MTNEFKVRKGLIVQGSGSTILDIQGSQGQLFSITDQLSGSLFSVNDISGLPILEVSSDDTVKMGTFGAEGLIVSGSDVTFPNIPTGTTETDIAVFDTQGKVVKRSNLSLQGIQGIQGRQGIQGIQGALGPGGVSGTTNYVAKFTGTTTLGNSQIFDNGTNVGIGTTSPTNRLHVASPNNEGIFMQGTSNGGHWFNFSSANSNLWSMGAQPGLMGWYNRTDSTYKMVITDGGNVGIRTFSPSAPLTVRSSGTSTIYAGNIGARFESNGAGYSSTIQLSNNVDASATIGLVGLSLGLGVGISQMVTITSGGNVLIGTTTDAGQKLQVSGNVSATSFIGALSGNSTTATTLQTARTINGTSFNGSANITTANWGTARTITIGSTGKSVNGSANVSWSLAEIGAYSSAGGNLTGPLTVANRTAISVAHWSAISSATGAIRIKLPGTHTGNWSMLVLRITAYEYTTNAHTVYYVSGHDWTSGWYNNKVTKIGSSNKSIRLGYDGTANEDYVVLGDVASSWSFGHVTVDVMSHPSFYSGNMDISTGWSISLVTSLTGVTLVTPTEELVWHSQNDGSGSGLDADLLDGNHASAFYLASNPSGYTTNTGTVTSVSGTGGYGGLTLSGTVTTSGNITLGGTPTGTWPISVSGNAATATSATTATSAATWTTARTLTIGSTGKSVNGSANVSWSLAEIGAAATSHTQAASTITAGTFASGNFAFQANLSVGGQVYSPAVAKGNSGTAVTFNWNDGNIQTVTMTGNATFTFSNPQSGASYQIIITQDATGSRTITWPTIYWESDVAPTLTGIANSIDVVTLTYDGSKYLGVMSRNFGTP